MADVPTLVDLQERLLANPALVAAWEQFTDRNPFWVGRHALMFTFIAGWDARADLDTAGRPEHEAKEG